MSTRRTRQQTQQDALSARAAEPTERPRNPDKAASSATPKVEILPSDLDKESTGLKKRDLSLLGRKQRWLTSFRVEVPAGRPHLEKAVSATLVFAQEEAGTAVCISPNGLLLTCSHCVAESPEELKRSKIQWLLFASGQLVRTKCVGWDNKRDLALLQITAAQPAPSASPVASKEPANTPFPYLGIATSPPKFRDSLLCVGHPGSEDLEATVPGIKTNYDVLHASTGVFRGYAKGQDLHDNSEIGALKHDCWTYWGHSGAPLIDAASGQLVGLHSSWDSQTGMRRGIPLEAIRQFLEESGHF